jgi:hypothetical protein
MLTKLITNAETGESEMVELTADELAQRIKDEAEYTVRDAATAQAATDKAALLAKLGITADEAKLLLS